MPVTSPPIWHLHGDDALHEVGGGSGQHWTPNHVQWPLRLLRGADTGHGFDQEEPDVAALNWSRADRCELESHSVVDAGNDSAGHDADKAIKMDMAAQNALWGRAVPRYRCQTNFMAYVRASYRLRLLPGRQCVILIVCTTVRL